METHVEEAKAPTKGLDIERRYTQAGTDPYDMFEWNTRTVEIRGGGEGKIVFRQEGVE